MQHRQAYPLCALLLAVMIVLQTSVPPPAWPPLPPAPAPGPLQIGINSHLATRYPDAGSLAVPAAIVNRLGADWVREDLHWHRIEPLPGQWDWVFSDNALHALDQHGLQILAVLGPSVGWAVGAADNIRSDVSYAPPPQAEFLRYTTAVVQRYAAVVDAWEVWNEPDLGVFWQPTPQPRVYAELLIAVAAVIRRYDPGTPILIGGINPFHRDYLAEVAAAGAWSSFDILAVHPYVDPNTPEQGALSEAIAALRPLMAQYGAKAVWATEVGVASGPGDRDARGVFDADQQADLLARTYLTLWQAGISHIFWYTLKDDPHNPYGLYRYGGGRADFSQEKPAAAAFRELTAAAAGAMLTTQYDGSTAELLDPLTTVTWQRPAQPNGRIRSAADGSQLDIRFTTAQNDYLVFAFAQPLALSADTHSLQIEVAGSAAGHALNVWLRDADGDILQYRLGLLDGSRSRLQGPIGGRLGDADRIEIHGNGRYDAPAAIVALVVDDQPDSWSGSAAITVRNLTARRGSDARALQIRHTAGFPLLLVWADQLPGRLPLPAGNWYRYDLQRACRHDAAADAAAATARIRAYSSAAAPSCSSANTAAPPRR
jgi:polysaccharide biosynthesis protein PslG